MNTAEAADTPVELTMRGTVLDTLQLNVNDNGTLVVGADHLGLVGPGDINVFEYNHADGGTVLFELTPDPDDVGTITAVAPRTLIIEGGTIGIRPVLSFPIDDLNEAGLASGLYADETYYEVIYSELREGVFDGTYSPTPLLQVEAEYGNYDGAPGEGDPTPGDVNDEPNFDEEDSDVRLRVTRVAFDEVNGLTPNQRAVAGGIENVYDPDDLDGSAFGNGIGLLFLLDEEEYPQALSSLHGAEHAQVANLTKQLGYLFNNWLADYLSVREDTQSAANRSYVWSPDLEQIAASRQVASDADDLGLEPLSTQTAELARGGHRTPGSFSVWLGGGGLWGNADGDAAEDVVGFDQTTWGIMVGADYQIDPQILVGIAGLYQSTDADFDDSDSSEIDSWQFGLYGTYDSGGFYVDAAASVGWSDISMDRRVYIPMVFDEIAESDTSAFLVTAGAEVGYVFKLDGGFKVQPLVGLDYVHASIDGFTESGAAPYNLTVDDTDADSLTSRLGFGVSADLDLGRDMRLVPELRAAWQHEFLDSEEDITAAFVGQPGSAFTAVGSDFGSDAALVGAGLTLEIQEGMEAFVDYNGRFSSGYTANAVSGGFRLSW